MQLFHCFMEIRSLCQPDELKGCSLCCGLFNLKNVSRTNLEHFLSGDYSSEILNTVRDVTSHVCTYQSFIAPGKPGCSLHPCVKGADERGKSLYGSKICEEYLCPAHVILDQAQKNLLISTVFDWYLYCSAILDPEGFIWIIELVEDVLHGGVDVTKQYLICRSLEFHGQVLSKTNVNLFYYSPAEYNHHKHDFSLRYNQEEQSDVKEYLRSCCNSSF